MEHPDDKDFSFLANTIKIPESFLDYLGDVDERPRIEREDDWTMVIIRIPTTDIRSAHEPYSTVPLGIILNSKGVLVTICYYHNNVINEFLSNSQKKYESIISSPDFILRIIDCTAFWFLRYLKIIVQNVADAGKQLQKSVKNDDLLDLMNIQRSLVFFNTSIKGDLMLLERIGNIYGENIDQDVLEDVDIELRQADSTVNIYSDILEGMMDSFASIISNNVNQVMKRMTGLSIILIVPTFIASLYGMNVSISLSENPYAFWYIIGICIILTGVLFIVLRRMKWV